MPEFPEIEAATQAILRAGRLSPFALRRRLHYTLNTTNPRRAAMLRRWRGDSDTQLVRTVLRGQKEAFGALVERYRARVYSTILARVGTPADAEDLAQDAFVAAYRQLDRLEDPARFGVWLRRIAENASTNLLRQRARRQRLLGELPRPDGAAADQGIEEEESSARVWAALQGLSPSLRESLLLFYLERHSRQETAAFLGISVGAVKQRLRRAREALRGALEEEFDRQVRRALQERAHSRDFVRKVMAALPFLVWQQADARPLQPAG
ncbi:MAG: sigma-70 family RNA polymerase sigma factor, partial [Candidatus Latescibacterota bacterium]